MTDRPAPIPLPASRGRVALRLRVVPVAAWCLCAATAFAQPATVAMSDQQRADRLLTVDCLLPGQVRQLGSRMTYLAPGRPIRTSAADCEIRGGEYVKYDRANYGTALRIWLPAAEGGDKDAQTNVGEIYERGVAGAPDYEKAAQWYRKAADQGYARAMINLGFLYEQGRGVPKDPVAALKLYRQAAGLSGSVNLEAPPSAAPGVSQEEVNALRRELERTRQELERARQELDQERLKASKEIERITQQKMAAAAAGNTDETRRLEALLRDREAELERRRQQVARVEQANEDYKAKLARLEGETAGMRRDLDAARAELAKSQAELDQRRKAASQQERDVAAARAELERQKQAAAATDGARTKALEAELAKKTADLDRQTKEIARLAGELNASKDGQRELDERRRQAAQQEREIAAAKAELERQRQAAASADSARSKTLEAELARKSADLERQTGEITRLERELNASKERLAKLEAKPGPVFPGIEIAPPSIQILDPSIVVTRDTALVKVRSGLRSRPVVGRVVAPAGLVSFTANDEAQQVDPEGLFRTVVDLGPGKTRVAMVAIDRQGKRATLEFFLEPDTAAAPVPPPRAVPPGLNLGNFYALLIGNQKYQKLRSLNSPVADVNAIETILRDRYGFKVTKLVDATRYEMLTELNKLMETLTERDSLLIYYAGHGEIDPATQTASWLPVDADPKNDSNWISSDDLTRKIGPMKARHVLVVADSCYSGVLTRSATSQAGSGATDEERYEWLKTVAAKKSRHLLSSGGKAPVMDGGGGGHSVFAATFIEALTVNPDNDIMDGRKLGEAVSARVLSRSKAFKVGIEQLPEYRPIQFADNEGGEFLFPPARPMATKVSGDAPATRVATAR